jgi:putative Mg2+ transporter-C (MgtC) family protein
MEVKIENKPGQIGKLGQILGDMNINIVNMEFKEHGQELLTVYFNLLLPANVDKEDIIIRLMNEQCIHSLDEL